LNGTIVAPPPEDWLVKFEPVKLVGVSLAISTPLVNPVPAASLKVTPGAWKMEILLFAAFGFSVNVAV